MNHLIKFIILLSIAFASYSCSDEFVNEKLEISGIAKSAIIISPTWESSDYQFTCEEITDADFNIIGKPDWLIIESNTGRFTNSIATIHASAIVEPHFSGIGFYLDQLVITSGGNKYVIPLYYLTEGNPSIQVDNVLEVTSNTYNNKLHISNSGSGILLWDIVSMPSWLKVNMNQFNVKSVMLGQGSSTSIPLVHDSWAQVQGSLSGSIVLKTNDKSNPLVEIPVLTNIGTPSLSVDTTKLTMHIWEKSKTLRITNNGYGILLWNFEEIPEWLSISHASGMFMAYSSNSITFTCDLNKVQSGLNRATMKLKSNDPDKPSVNIVVEYIPPIK